MNPATVRADRYGDEVSVAINRRDPSRLLVALRITEDPDGDDRNGALGFLDPAEARSVADHLRNAADEIDREATS